jgi:DnaJ-domain-containing protein 1
MAKRWWATGIGWLLGGPWWGLAGYLLGDRLDRGHGSIAGRRDALLVPLSRLTASLLQVAERKELVNVRRSVAFWCRTLPIDATEERLMEDRVQGFLQDPRELHELARVFASSLAGDDRLQFWWWFEELAKHLALRRIKVAPWLMQIADCWELTGPHSCPWHMSMSKKGRITPAEIAFWYRALELPLDADWDEVKGQYRKLAKAHHPDRVNRNGVVNQEDGEFHPMAQINSGYQVLKSWFGFES